MERFPRTVGGTSAVLTSLMSVLSNWPLVIRARNKQLTLRLAIVLGIVFLFGFSGAFLHRNAASLFPVY